MARMSNEEMTRALLKLIDEAQAVKTKASNISFMAVQILSEIEDRKRIEEREEKRAGD